MQNDQQFNNTCNFIDQLGTAAHRYGASSFRLESFLSRDTSALGLHGDFLVTSGVVDSVLWQGGNERQRIRINREEAGLNLAKLEHVAELVEKIRRVVGCRAVGRIGGAYRLAASAWPCRKCEIDPVWPPDTG